MTGHFCQNFIPFLLPYPRHLSTILHNRNKKNLKII